MLASALLESFHGRTVDLYPCAELLQDLYAFKLADKGFSYQIEVARSAAGGHGDRGIAFVLALLAARRGAGFVPVGGPTMPMFLGGARGWRQPADAGGGMMGRLFADLVGGSRQPFSDASDPGCQTWTR